MSILSHIGWLRDQFGATKAHQLKGAFVIAFDCRGCMASDHRFEYLAVCEDVIHDDGHQCGPWVRATVIKRDNRDFRDGDLGHVQLYVENTALQYMRPGLIMFTH